MSYNYIKCPCKNCTGHTETCHCFCEDYKEYRKALSAETKREKEEKRVTSSILSMRDERNEALRRKYGAKRR